MGYERFHAWLTDTSRTKTRLVSWRRFRSPSTGSDGAATSQADPAPMGQAPSRCEYPSHTLPF